MVRKPMHRLPHRLYRRQRGAAALIVVMLLFFVISLVAAYTSRNLIFEQRTATNQYRSTQAFEAAEAGVEWAIAQLNAGRIDNNCQASTNTSDESFRQRHLSINPATGAITRRPAGGSGTPFLEARCVFDGNAAGPSWSCRCPGAGSANVNPPAPLGATAAVAPAFVVRFNQTPAILGSRVDAIQLEVNSCTRLGNDCLNYDTNRGGTGDGVASVGAVLALRGALNRQPAAALTAMGSVGAPPSGVSVTLRNTSPAANGVTLHAAGTVSSTGLNLVGLPGTAPASTIVSGDGTLAPAAQLAAGFSAEDLRFASFFGMSPQTYRNQPGLPHIDCSGGCSTSEIATALERNPGRPVWLSGSSGTVTIDANLGTDTAPALLIVEGDLVFGNGATLRGLVYHRAKAGAATTTWSLNGIGVLQGAAVFEGPLSFSGSSATTTVNYDAAILRALRLSTGTFVRVPGSWKDFS